MLPEVFMWSSCDTHEPGVNWRTHGGIEELPGEILHVAVDVWLRSAEEDSIK